MEPETVSAKVIAPTTIYNQPAKVGSVVEVDPITFRNLAAKGRLEAFTPAKKGKAGDPPTPPAE